MGEKKKKRQEPERLAWGLAWYKPQQWARLREISVDADELEATFAEWLVIAEQAQRDFEEHFIFPEKVPVDVEELLAWCQKKKRPVDGAARSAYAAWLMQEKEKREGKGR